MKVNGYTLLCIAVLFFVIGSLAPIFISYYDIAFIVFNICVILGGILLIVCGVIIFCFNNGYVVIRVIGKCDEYLKVQK